MVAQTTAARERATLSSMAPELSRPQGVALGQRDRGRHDDCDKTDPARLGIHRYNRACGLGDDR